MKKLLILSFVIFASCASYFPGSNVKVTVPEGKNFFYYKEVPQRCPYYPYASDTIHYKFKLGPEWWTENLVWTAPEKGFGCKMLTIGRAPNYHRGGMNMALGRRSGEIIIYPRYYEPRGFYQENKLHELSQYGKVVHPNTWVEILMITNPKMEWWINGTMVHSIDTASPGNFFHWCYLGRNGWDLNYPGYDIEHNKFARATEDFTIYFVFLDH